VYLFIIEDVLLAELIPVPRHVEKVMERTRKGKLGKGEGQLTQSLPPLFVSTAQVDVCWLIDASYNQLHNIPFQLATSKVVVVCDVEKGAAICPDVV
jgi:hypothetical protein